MQQDILINWSPQEARVAVLENGAIQELHVERALERGRRLSLTHSIRASAAAAPERALGAHRSRPTALPESSMSMSS